MEKIYLECGVVNKRMLELSIAGSFYSATTLKYNTNAFTMTPLPPTTLHTSEGGIGGLPSCRLCSPQSNHNSIRPCDEAQIILVA